LALENEIELIADGDGIAVIGDAQAVELFLERERLPSRELALPRLSKFTATGAAGAKAAASFAESSGRWVKLTPESAKKVQQLGLTPTKVKGVSHAMIGKPGASKSWIQVENGRGMLSANPGLLAGAPALMTQLAMQQAMDEITNYLAAIDAKLDDVLRAQKDSVLAQMIGTGLQVDEAMTLRTHVGRVNDVMWSKVQSTAGTIAETQAYALLQLDALADKLEHKASIADLMKTTREAETTTRDWLAVLARCFQLQDGLAVLELDRVLDSAPEDLEAYRLGLRSARQERLEAIATTTERLTARIQAAAAAANSKVLFNPVQSPAVVQSSTRVTGSVGELHARLGIDAAHDSLEARRWTAAAADVRDRARLRGADALVAGRRLGSETRGRAVSASGQLASRLADRPRLRRKNGTPTSDED
jgi:hypothetical protein